MYLDTKNEMMVVREALSDRIDKLRIQIADTTIPVPGSLGEEIHKTRMREFETAIELHQRVTIQIDRINYQSQKKNES